MTSMPNTASASASSSSAQAPSENDDAESGVGTALHPVRPKSAFLFFLTEHRAKVKAAFPDLALDMESNPLDSDPNNPESRSDSRLPSKRAFGTLTQLLGVEWRRLTADQRAVYDEMSAADKRRYHTELAQMKQLQQQFYSSSHGRAQTTSSANSQHRSQEEGDIDESQMDAPDAQLPPQSENESVSQPAPSTSSSGQPNAE